MASFQDSIANSVASAEPTARQQFIKKTYGHLALAIAAFTGVEYLLLHSELGLKLGFTLATSNMGWLIVLAAFMGVSFIANKWASGNNSKGMQYAGLGLYVVAEAVIFCPLLIIATVYYPGIIQQAAVMTLGLTAGLTAVVFVTKKDFGFMGPIIAIASMIALGVIVASIIFGFNLGLLFSAVMVLVASGAILFETSNIMKRYNTNQYVAASLALFASVALLFWYIIRILMSLRD
jgi:FtsH-binding integral membrane protein